MLSPGVLFGWQWWQWGSSLSPLLAASCLSAQPPLTHCWLLLLPPLTFTYLCCSPAPYLTAHCTACLLPMLTPLANSLTTRQSWAALRPPLHSFHFSSPILTCVVGNLRGSWHPWPSASFSATSAHQKCSVTACRAAELPCLLNAPPPILQPHTADPTRLSRTSTRQHHAKHHCLSRPRHWPWSSTLRELHEYTSVLHQNRQ